MQADLYQLIMDLPFGRTNTTPDELRNLIDQDRAADLLENGGVDNPKQKTDQFLKELPQLLLWLEENGRKYPWRMTTDPWKVYISEILLQKTRADAVQQVFQEFFNKYPSPRSIRNSPDHEIRKTIESLGFGEKRTKTLRDVANILDEEFNNSVPDTLDDLMRPWRVGRYSARACMVFAYGKPMGLVDANITRVVERVFGYEMPQQPHKSDSVYDLMDSLTPDESDLCRSFNLAFLDLADSTCKPADPKCPECPLDSICYYS